MPPLPANPRKRAAPGASPTISSPPHSHFQPAPLPQQLTDEQFLRWGKSSANATSSYSNSPTYAPNAFNGSSRPPLSSSTQLTRRPTANGLATRAMRPFIGNEMDKWSGVIDEVNSPAQDEIEWSEDVEELERKAAIAKREAQTKRKHIPPFVQKLRSFLDDKKNITLIRWSERGDAFIVLDEDEFAKTLIPELFKHNNYASFVRQLNMYGFHKRVGLSDNSMRASERKNKSPSEYSHPYFKREFPDWLWLINKPKTGNIKKGPHVPAPASDEEEDSAEPSGSSLHPGSTRVKAPAQQQQTTGQAGDGLAHQCDLDDLRTQLGIIQRQQKVISNAIIRIRNDQTQVVGQVLDFQSQHDRHENSINAILTFLATVYNRSLEGHGAQNFGSMFANAIPPEAQGNVVDVEESTPSPAEIPNSPNQRQFKRQRLLLEAPPSDTKETPTSSTILFQTHSPVLAATHRVPTPVAEVANGNTSSYGVMSPRLDFNAQGTNNLYLPNQAASPGDASSQISQMEFTNTSFGAMLSHFENSNGNSPLTPKQRQDMLQLIAGNSEIGSNNALISPNPPSTPNLNQIRATQEEIEALHRLQLEQDASVQSLANLLQPLSPTGSIPSLQDTGYFDGQVADGIPGLDLDQFFHSNDYFSTQGNGNIDFGDGLNFNFDGSTDEQTIPANVGEEDMDERVFEAVGSSEEASPVVTPRDVGGDGGESTKKRKVG
ncbi:MAG: stress-responsive transcription factor hsf1 [Trizodia sp. TS-e1964]|nr:MAG: stress-responsive transcription factor hsf1 [Trizodia sp. TS-e1964]